jgi:chloramphenicol 3-O phosphotransferase
MLIYLNGTSSSGKSSIALELQKQIQKPVLYFSIDTVLNTLSEEDLKAIMGKQPYRVPIDWNSIFIGYMACVVGLVAASNFVIADCPIYDKAMADYFEIQTAPITKKMIVGVVCALDVLKHREILRQDRAIGTAQKQFEGIHKYIKYDFEVQSDRFSPLDLALQIYQKAQTII